RRRTGRDRSRWNHPWQRNDQHRRVSSGAHVAKRRSVGGGDVGRQCAVSCLPAIARDSWCARGGRDRLWRRRGTVVELSRDADIRFSYARDASGLEMIPDAVARPASVADVIEVVRSARAGGASITPAGAQTSTTAASIVDRGILVSMRAMSRVIDIDTEA